MKNHLRTMIVLCATAISLSAAEAVKSAEPPFHPGSETLVVFPDTEGYALRRPQIFNAMCQWVADQREARNIKYLLHVGDITNNNMHEEWKNARKAFDLMQGKVPYVLAAGNHDYDHTEGRLTYMNEYFKVEDLKEWPSFGGVYEKGKLENHYQFVTIHGKKWIILSLEMGPRNAVIDWANKVLEEHQDCLALILTHGYLYYNNVRYNHLKGGQRATPYNFYGEGADGEMLWNSLVRLHPNVMLVVCGHLSSAYVGYRKDQGDYGNIVHQMLVDYEKMRGGGSGFLRLLEFFPDDKTVQVRTYSPVTKGKNPIKPELEEFQFVLHEATRDEPQRPHEPLNAAWEKPIHRYSFNDEAVAGSRIADSAGDAHGVMVSQTRKSGCKNGQLFLYSNDESDGLVRLPPNILNGRKDASVEVWVTPTRNDYQWNTVWFFGDDRGSRRGDFFWYCFRTTNTHRTESANNGHNIDIQMKGVPVEPGKRIHLVVTYDDDGGAGADGTTLPLLRCFRNGELVGQLKTTIHLTDVTNTINRIGPFAGIYDEFRIYDVPLGPTAVKASFEAGPDKLPE